MDVLETINVNDKLYQRNCLANDTSRLDENDEKCVNIIKEILIDKISN